MKSKKKSMVSLGREQSVEAWEGSSSKIFVGRTDSVLLQVKCQTANNCGIAHHTKRTTGYLGL